jgi:hypothetical protein
MSTYMNEVDYFAGRAQYYLRRANEDSGRHDDLAAGERAAKSIVEEGNDIHHPSPRSLRS